MKKNKILYLIFFGFLFLIASLVAYKIRSSINVFGPFWLYFLLLAIFCFVFIFVKK
jgi:hypothetical protein